MTDKVQKIREEVENLHGNPYYIMAVKDVLAIIDSLQEEPMPKFKIGDRIKFKGVYDEDVVRTITDIQKYDDGSCRYIFADGSLHSVGNNEIELMEEPVSEELEEAASRYAEEEYNRKNPATLPDRCRGCYAPLMYAFKAGVEWQKEKDDEEKVLIYKHGFNDCEEHIKEALLSEVLPCFIHGGEADEVVAKLDEVLNQKK